METKEIQETITDFIGRMGVTASSVGVHDSHGRVVFNIQTDDSSFLIGKRGETLRAINALVQRMAERRSLVDKNEKFSIDVNNYNEKRIEFLENQARTLAERVKTLKHEIEMPPMNPYERMIVHEALKDEHGVVTESSGEGRLRHVVIRYTN